MLFSKGFVEAMSCFCGPSQRALDCLDLQQHDDLGGQQPLFARVRIFVSQQLLLLLLLQQDEGWPEFEQG